MLEHAAPTGCTPNAASRWSETRIGGVKWWVHQWLEPGVLRSLRWVAPVERLPRSPVEFRGDGVEVGLGVDGQVGALGDVLADQPVGVLVAAPLPRAVRVAEVHRDPGRDGELRVRGEFLGLVQVRLRRRNSGSVAIFCEHDRDPIRGPVIGHPHQHHVPGLAFDQGRDLGPAALADDQVALPEPGHGPVRGLDRALADVHHPDDVPPGHRRAGPVDPPGPPPPGRQHQLGSQLSAGLQVQGLVDPLVRHPHSLIVGELQTQPATHLPRGPLPAQPVPDRVMQRTVHRRHPVLRTGPTRHRPLLRRDRPIPHPPTITRDLPRDHRMIPTQHRPDPPHRSGLPAVSRTYVPK